MNEIIGSTAAALSVMAAHTQKVTDKPSLPVAAVSQLSEDEEAGQEGK